LFTRNLRYIGVGWREHSSWISTTDQLCHQNKNQWPLCERTDSETRYNDRQKD